MLIIKHLKIAGLILCKKNKRRNRRIIMQSRILSKGKYNFIDLFAGAGGLSEGFVQAGFNPIAHVEMNPFAAQTLVTRSAYYYLKQSKQLDIYYQLGNCETQI